MTKRKVEKHYTTAEEQEILSKDAEKLEVKDLEDYFIAFVKDNKLNAKAYKNCKSVLKEAFRFGHANKILTTDYIYLFQDLPRVDR